MARDYSEKDYISRYRAWRFFQVLLPFTLIIIMGLYGEFTAREFNLFYLARYLGQCDLLLPTALILIGVAAEFRHLTDSSNHHSTEAEDDNLPLEDLVHLSLFLGIVILVVYAMVQIDVAGSGNATTGLKATVGDQRLNSSETAGGGLSSSYLLDNHLGAALLEQTENRVFSMG